MKSDFFHFGPLLFKTTVDEETVNEVGKLCNKDENLKYHESLAAHIAEEYQINFFKLEKILENYLEEYKKFHLSFYGEATNFYMSSAWVNFMKRNEFNPVHVHWECDLAGVLYLSVPNEIKEENKNYSKSVNKSAGPGQIKFIVNTPTPGFISERDFLPSRGDLFIFPSKLMHTVAPFKSNVERISVAFNIKNKEFK